MAAVVDLRTSLGKLEQRIGTKDQQGVLDEIQNELRTLPARFEDYLEGPRLTGIRRGRFHPMMIRDLAHMGPQSAPATGILVLASMFRDTMLWLYEMGVELYRIAKHGSHFELQEAAREFRRVADVSIHGPMSREFMGRSKELRMMFEEIDPLVERTLAMLDLEDKPGRRKPKEDSAEDL